MTDSVYCKVCNTYNRIWKDYFWEVNHNDTYLDSYYNKCLKKWESYLQKNGITKNDRKLWTTYSPKELRILRERVENDQRTLPVNPQRIC